MFSLLLLFGEIFICTLLIYCCKKFFKTTIGEIGSMLLVVIFIVGMFLSNSWVQKMPIVYDNVKIVAMGEKNDNSQGVEVSVRGITVRSLEQKFPEIKKGKWFFTTENNYMWRNSKDPRQPEGTTKSITLKVPVGTERALLFKKSDWGGKATVEFRKQETIVDTYTTGKLELEDSGMRRQVIQLVGRLCILGIIMCLFTLLLYALCRIIKSENEKHINKIVYGSVAAVFFVLTFSYLKTQEFWLDEMFQIGFSGTGKSLYETLMVTETTPPIFRLLANVWYNIMPYGEEWLLLLPTLFCAGFIYTVGILGEEIGGKYVGYTSTLLAATSSALLGNGAREFRSNALLAMLCCIFMLYYIKRMKTGKHSIAVIIIMVLLAYTHYFGVFICGAAFLLDVYYYFNKKKKLKDFVPYIVAGLLYVPWIFRFLELGQIEFEAAWQIQPSLRAVYNVLLYLCGSTGLMFLLAIGIIFIIFNKKQDSKNYDARFSMIFIAFVMIVCLYTYGTFIRPQATLWSHRYFLNILACIIVIIAYGIVQVGRLCIAGLQKIRSDATYIQYTKKACCILLATYLLISNIPNITANYTPAKKQDYKGAAETIYSHVDAYRGDSLVVFLYQDYVVDGWYEYYMTMQGKRDDIDYVSVTKIPADKQEAEEFFKQYKTIYFCYLMDYGSSSFKEQINKNYKVIKDDTSTCVRIYRRIEEEGI